MDKQRSPEEPTYALTEVSPQIPGCRSAERR